LLKRKADDAIAAAPPPSLPHDQPLPPPAPNKRPRTDSAIVTELRGLFRAGSRRLDALRISQMAAQEAMGVMGAAMLKQQQSMREITVWEMEMEESLRRITLMIREEEEKGL